jgi:hypothetical protein
MQVEQFFRLAQNPIAPHAKAFLQNYTIRAQHAPHAIFFDFRNGWISAIRMNHAQAWRGLTASEQSNSPQEQSKNFPRGDLVDAVGIEPTTCRLRAECSAS